MAALDKYMMKLAVMALILFALAVVMTMTGRGGGNYYVLVLVLASVPMHEAATTGQFILFTTAGGAALVFRKHEVLSLKLAFLMGSLTVGTAFCGGYFAHLFAGVALKALFSFLLVIAALLMLYPVRERSRQIQPRSGYWNLKIGDEVYAVNLGLVVPIALATGFCAGMVGVSGGSFLVPLMVLGCGVPMRIAVGTASILVAATACAGFLGHTLQGSFSPGLALPLAPAAIAGGVVGGRMALKTRSVSLKKLFAVTTLAAAVLMMVNILVAR